MGLFDFLTGRDVRSGNEPAIDDPNPVGAAASFPRFDSGGRPIVEFTPTVRSSLGLDTGTRFGLADVYRSQAAVRLCVDFLATNIAHCKLKVYTRNDNGDRQEVPESHPLRMLLENPNSHVSSYEFIRDSIADHAIFGNAFWVKRGARDKRALVRVPPCYVTGTGGHPAAGPTDYKVDVGGGPVPMKNDGLVHFREYNPEDIRFGVSVLEALTPIVAEEKAAANHRRGFWRNSARHEGWIKRPKQGGHWTREQRREFRADWQEAMSGADNAGKVAILEDDMELHSASFSPKDAEFIEGREWGLSMVATAYHIPLAVLSRGGTFTFASMKEFHITVYVDTLGPRMAEFEKAINTQLVPDYGDPDLFVEFNIEEKLQGDFETQSEAMRRAIHVPYMSVNEGRAIRNLPRIDDPDFDQPAKLLTYEYADDPTAPRVVRTTATQEAALNEDADPETVLTDDDIAAAMKELTNGHK